MRKTLTKHIIITTVLLIICTSAVSAGKTSALQSDTLTEYRADSMLVAQLRQQGVSFSHDNSVTLLMSGQEKFDDLFQTIRQARESIHMEYFNFRNDSIANLLYNILGEKAAQGVEVRLLYDAFGNSSNNQPLKKKHLDRIRSMGIQIYEFDPIRFPWVNHVFARDHRKIVVIDGKIAYTGGMNVADYYINGTPVVGEWHDMHCRIEGPEVNTLQRIFISAWKKVTKEDITAPKYFRANDLTPSDFTERYTTDCPSAGHQMVGIINREPHTSNKIIRQFYLNAINDARDSIKLINPYFTLSHKLKKALKRAVKRGVKVEIMLSVKSDIPLTPDCGFYNAHKLMKKGCHVWMYKPGFHHTKIIMVDGQFCTVGSANLNARSLRWDYEDNAVIIDACTTQQLSDLFDSQKQDSFLLTPQTWNEWRSPWQKFRGWFAHLLAPFL